MLTRHNKYLLYTSLCLIFLVITIHYRQEISLSSHDIGSGSSQGEEPTSTKPIIQAAETPATPPAPPEHTFKYKPIPSILPNPIVDNFPLAAAAQSAKDLPPIPPWNEPPAKHVPEKTPLFIGFTRNWRLLQQVVVSYITAGWPPEDIYVVENTGVMNSNAKSLLSLQNPFFLNHTRLHLLGVNILVTPTLLTFAQLQNYYISHSLDQGWKQFFWGHMDIVALSFEDKYENKQANTSEVDPAEEKYEGFKSLYKNCVDTLREATEKNETTGEEKKWALRFFMYDKLALVNVAAFVSLGAWDTQIPFYGTDCDMHARINMAGLEIKEVPAGLLLDVASSLDDLYTLYRKVDSPPASFIDPQILEKKIQAAADAKAEAEKAAAAAADSKVSSLLTDTNPIPPNTKRGSDSDSKTQEAADANANSKEVWYSHLLPSLGTHKPWRSPSSTINSPSFALLHDTLKAMEHSKATSSHGRNTWQARQRGGEGDPFYRDSAGFERGIAMTIDHGRAVYAEKWGHRDCDIWEKGYKLEDAWRTEKDW
ncbi:hypothetical protein VTL71DRAFT_14785 [Oculimacula yallundae]|uniref:Uncharacterized protein n=1 Tax=Oculimacula yallundae TaxID=86028 RepID=A0ABR4CK12_9HELO